MRRFFSASKPRRRDPLQKFFPGANFFLPPPPPPGWRISTFPSRSPCCGPASCGKVEHASGVGALLVLGIGRSGSTACIAPPGLWVPKNYGPNGNVRWTRNSLDMGGGGGVLSSVCTSGLKTEQRSEGSGMNLPLEHGGGRQPMCDPEGCSTIWGAIGGGGDPIPLRRGGGPHPPLR